MGVKQSFFLALKSLATSKMRALLTMLGIIIGVAAVIVIISLGDGMQKLMSDSFNELGANLIQVSVQSSGSSREVDMDDMYDLVEKNPKYLSAVSPYITVSSVSARTPGDTFTLTVWWASARPTMRFGHSPWSRAASCSTWTCSAPRRCVWWAPM